MRAAGIRIAGGPVEMIELPEPRPLADDEVLIEVRAAGVANWDEIVRTGGWDVGRSPPMALGVEAAGTIAAVGRLAGDCTPGNEVMTHPLPLRDQGTWAPWLIAPAELIARKPSGASWEEAAAFPVPALTAAQTVREALEVVGGERVLVHGAGGVTGGALVSFAALSGAEVIATAGPSSQERVRELGASDVIDYHAPNWPDEVVALTDETGVDAAVNAARDGAAAAIRAVRDGGRVATIASDPPAEQRGIRVTSVYVRPDGELLQQLADLLAQGKLEIPVARVFAHADAAAALAAATGGHPGGAVVLAC